MLPFRLRSAAAALAFALTLSLSAGPLVAQSSKGILTGSAKDSTGASIPNATVTIRGEQTGETRTATTKADGSYRFDALSPEPYTIKVEQTGFSTFKAEHVNVAPSLVTSYDLPLAVGSHSDTVTVEADQAMLNTENGQLSQTISANEISTLPVLSLNPFELAVTIPGVQSVNGTNQFSNGANSQVNGARPRSNNFLLDSQEINDIGIGGQAFQPQIVDMYQDLTVITSTASAEFGRAGGGIFNLVTKSGTNSFHGTVYDRYAGSGLNSKDFAIRGTDTAKPRFDTHTIGFTLGGPIVKDKLFAFGGAQFARFYGKESINPVLLPDAAGKATLASLTDPTAVKQNALLTTYLSNYAYLSNYSLVTTLPTSKIILGLQPGCNGGTATCSVEEAYFQRPFPAESSPDTQWSYRIDFKPSTRDSFYVRYLHDRSSLSPDFFANAAGGALGLDTYQGGPSELGAGSWTHVFTPNIVNELRGSETRINFLFAPLPSTLANPAYALPTLNVSGFPSLGAGQNFPQGRIEDLYQMQDTFSYTHGRQTIRAGFDIGRQLEKDVVSQNAKGTASLANSSARRGLVNFLSDQLGNGGAITKTNGPLRVDPHGWRSGFFVQDDFKVTPQFTLNLGARYDYTTDPENSLQYPAIDPANPYQAITTVIKVNNDTNNVSPRLGFAWTPSYGGYFGSGKTVIRGGFGIFYDSYFSNFVTNAAQSAPNAIAGTLQQTAQSGPITISGNLTTFNPTTLSPLASVTSVDKNMRNPQTYQYNLGIEQEFGTGFTLHIAYVGNRGEHLFANQQFNYRVGSTGLRLNTTRGVINARGNYADSNYNGVQVDGTARFGRTLAIRGNYIFSKDLDDGSEIFTTGDNSTSYSANLAPGGRRQDYGPSAFDHRQFMSISYAWSPRGFRSDSKAKDLLLNILTRNFTVGGVSQLQSGPYSTFNVAGVDINGDGSTTNDRPIIGSLSAPLQTAGIDGTFTATGTPGVYYDVTSLNDTGAYVPVTANQVHFIIPYGPNNEFLQREVGRNSFLNPGTTTHNLAVEKGFGVGFSHFESAKFLLRAEATNIFNHNDRGYLDTNVQDFGTSALTPTSLNTDNLARIDTQRTLAIWAKFVF